MPSDFTTARERHVKTIHNTCDWCTTWDGCEEVALPWPCGESQFIALADELAEMLDAVALWLEAEAEYPRPDPKPAMRLQAKMARAALAKWEASRAK